MVFISTCARRFFLRFFLAIIGFLAVGWFAPTPAHANPPNIVVIMTDDQSFEQIRFLQRILTAFHERGLVFNNSYVNLPLCCPSRTTFFTGQDAQHHGIFFNAPTSSAFQDGGAQSFVARGYDQATILTALKAVGYTTGFFGKALNGYARLPVGYTFPGLDEAHIFYDLRNGGYYNYSLAERVWPDTGPAVIHQFGTNETDYATDKLARQASQFIASVPTPFFVYYAPHAPHDPAIPPLRYRSSLPDEIAPRNPAYNEADVSDKPNWVKNLYWGGARAQQTDILYGNAARSLLAVQDGILTIGRALRERGVLQNTAIFVTSDNGFSYGEHRWAPKQCPYNGCAKVPLLINYPPLITTPKEIEVAVSNVDLYPTIAELAGVPLTGNENGMSLVPLFTTTEGWPRKNILSIGRRGEGDFSECAPNDTCSVPNYDSIIEHDIEAGEHWKLIEYETGEKELYNLQTDPYEIDNLAYDPGHVQTVIRLGDDLNGRTSLSD